MMLRISESLTSTIISRLILAQVSNEPATGEKTAILGSLKSRVEIAVARAGIDCLLVGGITFFASLIALGYSDLFINIKISIFSAVTIAGLTFFQEVRSQMKRK